MEIAEESSVVYVPSDMGERRESKVNVRRVMHSEKKSCKNLNYKT